MGLTQRTSGIKYSVPDTIQVFETPGTHTWTKPEGCVMVHVQLVGAGGGGSGYVESGGAGGYSEKYIDVTHTDSVVIVVGTGGSATHYYGNSGDGSMSQFGTHLLATGGYGANRNSQHEGGRGGLGVGGDINLYGGKGSGHGSGNSHWGSNTGGRSYFGGGNGRRHSNNTDNTGEQLAAPGTGGCGGIGDSSNTGSQGRHGIVIVHEFYA